MNNYDDFISKKLTSNQPVGFATDDITSYGLFDFQSSIVDWAIRRGRAAIFADTGLGKTAMQLAWADQVADHTGKPVLIVCPLCVAQQTVAEANRIGINEIVYARSKEKSGKNKIVVVNYEMLDYFEPSDFGGVVLDESSILKSIDGKTKNKLIDMFSVVDYRLSCTATPSPNDFMELGNQAEFLGIMSHTEMLAQYFIHDGGETAKWRLKGHGKIRFWEWIASWAVCIKTPDDLGFDGARYILPPLEFYHHTVESDYIEEGDLFAKVATTLQERRAAKRSSLSERVKCIADIVNNDNDYWIIWCHLNDESKALTESIKGAVEVTGTMQQRDKEDRINAFSQGKIRVLISKPSICGWGLNWQHCHKIAFVGLDDSYESYYQAIRRCYRFGQKSNVTVHTVSSEGEGAIYRNLERKAEQAETMGKAMIEHMREFSRREVFGMTRETNDYIVDSASGNNWTLKNGDCVELIKMVNNNSIDYTIFSPPFSSLYTYSNSPRDMGNSKNDDEFYRHFEFLVEELFRVTKHGRLLSFHCMNIPSSLTHDGVIGIKDFRGDLIRMFVNKGWIFHSEVVIWKDPVTAMQRTKSIGLLYKQLRKDSCMSRQGIPDYLVTMRKPGVNPEPVTKTHDGFPVDLWQRYASPVWMDINPSNTLQFKNARESDDERHIAPLQLEVIERAISLWTNPNDIVLSPFAGIGSEGYVSVSMDRRSLGFELKKSYFDLAVRNMQSVERNQQSLFNEVDHG